MGVAQPRKMKVFFYLLLVAVIETCAQSPMPSSEPLLEITEIDGSGLYPTLDVDISQSSSKSEQIKPTQTGGRNVDTTEIAGSGAYPTLDVDISHLSSLLVEIKPTPTGNSTSVDNDKESLSSASVITPTPSGEGTEAIAIPDILVYIGLAIMSVLFIAILVTAVCCFLTECF